MEQRYKVVLLGDAAVGKTCLVERFVSGQFNDNSTATIGAAYRSRSVSITDEADGQTKSISLELWDTAGQERFRAITSMYYKGAAGALVVYSVDDMQSLEVCKEFVDELLKNAPHDISVLLVGNKADLQNKAIAGPVVEAYAKQMGLVGMVECSALTGIGVEEAFTLLATQVHKTQQLAKANGANKNAATLTIEGEDQKKKGCC